MKVQNSTEVLVVKVKKVFFGSKTDSFTILKGVVMKEDKSGKFKETSRIITVKGMLLHMQANDLLKATMVKTYIRGTGYQYYVQTYIRIYPGVLDELKKFLLIFEGIGLKNAEKLVNAYGVDVIVKFSIKVSLSSLIKTEFTPQVLSI